jgi:hypothetical protein
MAEQTDDPTTKMVSAGLAQAWLQLAALAEHDKPAAGAGKTDAAAPPANTSLPPIEQS